MAPSPAQPVVVYRGTDVTTLDLLEGLLRVEGLQPTRLGRADPALLGAGIGVVEQRIAVPPAHAARAEALIAGACRPLRDVAADARLEALALREPLPADAMPPGAMSELGGEAGDAPRALRTLGLLMLAAVALLILLR